MHLFSNQDHALYASNDAGMTWRLVSQNTVTRSDQIAFAMVHVGQQPGLVYGFHESCDRSEFPGCFWTAHGVAKSLDGGVTCNGLPAGLLFESIVVSPANLDVDYLIWTLPTL
jgi:hypothetical protein